jgi:uncharacterized protein YkwD
MKSFFLHLFTPKESNNHRAKLLHHTNLFLTIAFLFLASFFVQGLRESFPSVLGINTNMSSEDLLFLTNQERQKNGASPLILNEQLVSAAEKKADDMFEYNYWAHNSPTGKTPWVFIKSSGYKYIYAGENLARGFSSAEDVVKAWMESPNHRANMLSSNYQDVGFAVKIGKLNGKETVLVVEEFGNLNMPLAKNNKIQEVATASDVNSLSQKAVDTKQKPLIDSSFFSSSMNIIVVLVFIFVLVLDMLIIERKKIMRFVGHNIDHVLYLILVLVLIGIFGKGVII